MTLLRPHLRTCLMCRARLRDYRATPAKVAAVAPPVAVGYSLLDSARFLLDAAGGWLSARGAGLAARWHQTAELAAGHKVAAVVASTAALAGGGVATVATVASDPDPARSAAPAAAPAQTSPQPPFATSGVAVPAAVPDRDKHDVPRREPQASEQRDPTPDRRETPSGEFAPGSPAPAPAPSPPGLDPAEPAQPEPAAGSSGGEFSP